MQEPLGSLDEPYVSSIDAYALIRGLHSDADALDFGDFRLEKVTSRNRQRWADIFAPAAVYHQGQHWVWIRHYSTQPTMPNGKYDYGSGGSAITQYLFELLFCLRLFRTGDVYFSKLTFVPSDKPESRLTVKINEPVIFFEIDPSHKWRYEFNTIDIDQFKAFCARINSAAFRIHPKFLVARSYFLQGSSKVFYRFNRDRIVDYCVTLESVLTNVEGLLRNQIGERASRMAGLATEEERIELARVFKTLYDYRRQLVHGSGISSDENDSVDTNMAQVEPAIRTILTNLICNAPADECEFGAYLNAIYHPTEEQWQNWFNSLKMPKGLAG